jgi:hypothetical protein
VVSPFERHLNANDAENWEVQYVRKLVRDVKTVSKGVMVVSASAVGGELLFEAEPLDNTVYSKVSGRVWHLSWPALVFAGIVVDTVLPTYDRLGLPGRTFC